MIRIRLFGALEMEEADGASVLSVLSQPKRMGLLAFLLTAHPRGFHSRDKLLALFWPEADEEHARNSLRQSLHFLRRSLGDDSIINRGEDVAANPARFSCDVLGFTEALDREDWQSALDLYAGPFLEGFHLTGSSDFALWVDTEREGYQVGAAKAAEKLVGRWRSKADLAGAAEAARRWVQLSPGSGRAVAELARLQAERGDRVGALTNLERFRERLRRDFGLEPSEEISTVEEEIRQGISSSAAEDSAPTVTASPGTEHPAPSVADPAAAPDPQPSAPVRSTPSAPPLTAVPRTNGRTARWTILAFMAMIALGYAFFFISRTDRRTAVRLTGFQDLRPESGATSFPPDLIREMREVMDRSKVVRPVTGESGFQFLQSGSIVEDTVRLVLDGLDPDVGSVLQRSHPFREPLSEAELADLATLLVQDIERALAGRSDLAPEMRGTRNLAAYQMYLEGRALWALRDPDQFLEARRSFEEAVRADSAFALGYAALADVFNLLGAYDYGVLHPDSAHRLAREAARKANALDDELAEALAALATTMFFYEWDFPGAEALYRSALRLDPTYEHGNQWLSLLLSAQKEFDLALSLINEALRSDSSEVILSARARIHYFARDFRQALLWYERALDAGDDFIPALLGKGLTAVMAGEFDTAAAAYQEAEAHLGGPKPVTLAVKGHLMASRGDTAGARGFLLSLEAARTQNLYIPPEYLAMIHLGLGEHDQALDYLEESFVNGSNVMTILGVEPLLDPLRSNERFQRLVDRVGEGRVR